MKARKNVFRVTIHYSDGTLRTVDIIASDDVKARVAALEEDAETWQAEEVKPRPKVAYCEVKFVCEAISS